MRPVFHTYMLDIPEWRAQGSRAWPQPEDLGLPLPATGFRVVQGQKPTLGEGRLAPSISWAPRVAPHGVPFSNATPFLPTPRSSDCSQPHFSDGKTEAREGSVPGDLAEDEGLTWVTLDPKG